MGGLLWEMFIMGKMFIMGRMFIMGNMQYISLGAPGGSGVALGGSITKMGLLRVH